MSKDLYSFIFTSMRFLVPSPSREAEMQTMAKSLVVVVESENPLFKDDDNKFRTASAMIAVAYREGSLRSKIVGDCTESKPGETCKGQPRSFCTMQIHQTNGGTSELNEDPVKCFRAGFTTLRTSVRTCRKHPIAWYVAGGPDACENTRSQRLSDDRMWLAGDIYKRFKD